MTLDPDLLRVLQKDAGAPQIQTLPLTTAREGFRARTATLARPQMDAIEEVSIGSGAREVALRFYRPTGAKDLPIILYIHGGGFVIGDLDTHDPLARSLAAARGALVVSVGYALAPEHRFPAGLEDCLAAWRWLEAKALSLGGNPAAIAIAGDSAGANLAVACTRRLCAEGAPAPVAQLLAYPVAAAPDPARGSYRDRGTDWGLTTQTMQWFWDHYTGTDPSLSVHPDLAPVHASDLQLLPRTWLLTAEYDPLRDEGIALAGGMAAAGVAVTHIHEPAANHGFLSWGDTVPLAARTIAKAAHWLADG